MDRLRITFLYDLGDRVRWDQAPTGSFTVVWRRWHQGETSTWVQYGLVCDNDTSADPQIWQVYEPDLEPLEDEA